MGVSDNFSAFLATVQRGSQQPPGRADLDMDAARRIIAVLRDTKEIDVVGLAKRAELDFFVFSATLQSLASLNAVTLEGQTPQQIARLGSNSEIVASLLKA